MLVTVSNVRTFRRLVRIAAMMLVVFLVLTSCTPRDTGADNAVVDEPQVDPVSALAEIRSRLGAEAREHLDKCLLHRGFETEPQRYIEPTAEYDEYFHALVGDRPQVDDDAAIKVSQDVYDENYGCQPLVERWSLIRHRQEISAIEEPIPVDESKLANDPVLLELEQEWLRCIRDGGYPEVTTYEKGNSYFSELADSSTMEAVEPGKPLPAVQMNEAQSAYLAVRDQCDAAVWPRVEKRTIELHSN